MRPPPGSFREKNDAELLHRLDLLRVGRGPEHAGFVDDPSLGESREREHLANPQAVAVVEDALRDLVLALGANALIIPSEHEDVPSGGARPLPVVDVVRNESNDPSSLT